MGTTLCNGSSTYNVEKSLEVTISESCGKCKPITLKDAPLLIPESFLVNLPKSKVVLLSGRSRRSSSSKAPTIMSVQRFAYDVPDDFVVPPELCIEHEQGIPLVCFFK